MTLFLACQEFSCRLPARDDRLEKKIVFLLNNRNEVGIAFDADNHDLLSRILRRFLVRCYLKQITVLSSKCGFAA